MKKKIVVVGSTGVDHVLNVTRFAEEGETLHVDKGFMAAEKVPIKRLPLRVLVLIPHSSLK